jgi:hypothetical protein
MFICIGECAFPTLYRARPTGQRANGTSAPDSKTGREGYAARFWGGVLRSELASVGAEAWGYPKAKGRVTIGALVYVALRIRPMLRVREHGPYLLLPLSLHCPNQLIRHKSIHSGSLSFRVAFDVLLIQFEITTVMTSFM